MSQETVLVMTARMDPALVKVVTQACEHARVKPVMWDGTMPQGIEDPTLLVAALPAGERTIPADVAVLVTKTFRALPLLLLSAEPLIRNCITLQSGRVTLLGVPLTPQKISGRIRMALVGHAESGFYPLVGDGGRTNSTVRIQEFRGRDWWVAAVGRHSDGHAPFPSVRKLGPHGFAGLLPVDVRNPPPPETLDQAAEALVAPLPSEQALAAVKEKVGARAAGVWFAPSSQRWTFYCPEPDLHCWLVSPVRLPARFRLPAGVNGNAAGHGATAWRQLPAASGDLIVICALEPAARSVLELDINGGELWKIADGGGPAVLDYLESRFAQADAASAALIVELR
jgi:hypothetical protein